MSKQQKILLVDDLPENLMALEAILAEVDCILLTATSGAKALCLMAAHEIVLVVLDLQMPGMDGFAVAEVMRQSEPTRMTPVIFVASAGQTARYITQGQGVGAVDYMQRPLDRDVLQGKARFFLDLDLQKRRLQEKLRLSQESRSVFLKAMGEDGGTAPD
jgi:CheY-like chemotaxis protein